MWNNYGGPGIVPHTDRDWEGKALNFTKMTAYLNHDLGSLRCLLTAINVMSSSIREPIHGSPMHSYN